MSQVEIIALLRVALYLIGLYFTVRGRYWLLSGAFSIGAGAAMASALGTPREIVAVISIPITTLLVLHALDVTRLPRRERIR